MKELKKVKNFEEAVKMSDSDKMDGQFEKKNKEFIEKSTGSGY